MIYSTKQKVLARVESAAIALCCVAVVVLTAAALLSLSYGVDDVNLMRVFSMDEPSAVEQMLQNLAAHDLDPRGFYNYGFLYQEVGYALIRLLEIAGFTADVRLVAISLRLVSFFAYLALLVVVYTCVQLLNRRSAAPAALCAAYLASVPELYRWGQAIHPDILSAALVLGALVVAFSAHTVWRAVLASGVAGLAFGVKYTGGFVLPFCVVPYYLRVIYGWRVAPRWPVIFALPLAALAFAACWLATNPYVLSHWYEFCSDLLYEAHHTATGHGKIEPADPLLWWPVWYGQLGAAGVVLTLLGLTALIGALIVTCWQGGTVRRFLRRAETRNQITLIGYVAASILYLTLQVHMREGRYLLHVLPALVAAGFAGLAAITYARWDCRFSRPLLKPRWNAHSERVGKTLGDPGAPSPNAPRVLRSTKAENVDSLSWKRMLVLPMLALVAVRAFAALQATGSDLAAKSSHPHLQAGYFLSEHFPAETRILADVYSYVPARFPNQAEVMGVDVRAVRDADPDVIVINQTASGRWCWKEPGTSFADRRLQPGTYFNPDRICSLQRWMLSESSPFRLVYENEEVAIWSKTPAK